MRCRALPLKSTSRPKAATLHAFISLPLSSAVLLNSGKHSVPQFPPRLKVQRLKPNQWARAPNRDQQLHALKLSDIRGWSMLCEDTVPMIALHIPEEDRYVSS